MSDDGKHIVIRPLAYCPRERYSALCRCKSVPDYSCNLCGSQPNLQRQVIADMLRDWDKRYPGRIETMFSAMQNVVPSHLCDTNLFDFKGIHGSEVVNGGDLAFDREEIPLQPAGWQPEEDENQLDELRLNVVEVEITRIAPDAQAYQAIWRPEKTRPASHPAIPKKMLTLAPCDSTFHYFNNRTRHVFPLIFPPCNCFHAL